MRYLLPLPLFLTACAATVPVASQQIPVPPGDELFVQTAIANAMKDPDSVKWRRMEAFRLANGDRVICGEVNAKNSFGAYVGYDPVFVRFDPETYDTRKVVTGDFAAAGCAQARSGTLNVTAS